MTKASKTSLSEGNSAISASDNKPSHCISLAHRADTASSTEILDDMPLRVSDRNGKHKLKIKKTMPANAAAKVRQWLIDSAANRSLHKQLNHRNQFFFLAQPDSFVCCRRI